MSEPPISSVLRGRDRVLIGLFVLVNVVVVVAVVLLNRTDEDAADGSKGDAVQRAPRAGSVVVNGAIGARIRKPRGWKAKVGGRMLVLRSPDSSTIMSISQPPGGGNQNDVLRSALAVIGQGYRDASARPLRGRVAGLPTVSRVVSATNKRGVRLNVLVSSPQGRGRAWLVQVFSGPGARARRLPEAQVALRTLRLRG